MASSLVKIFEPVSLGPMKLRNRLVMPPMSMNYATEDGFVSQRNKDYYEARAKGGVGLIILEATCVESPRGKAFDRQPVLDDDKYIPGFRELAGTIHKHGAKVAMQLHHAGAATHTYTSHMQPVGPSSLAWPGYDSPRELAVSEIKGITAKFAQAAVRAKKAGLDGVEIHGAHFYLFAQFLSPWANTRRDIYGGSLENRGRFLIETLHAVREAVGKDYPVWCRINGQEYGKDNVFTLDEARELSKMLEAAGADALHVSSIGFGDYLGYHTAIMYDPSANLAHLAEAVKKEVKIPVIAVGKISLETGERLLKEGKADLIATGRPLIADPDLPRKCMEGRFEDVRPCIWCRVDGDIWLNAKRSPVRCAVNPTLGHEREYEIKPAPRKKRVLVIGGGPAGMEAARIAALRGHEVMLYEKEKELGGQMFLGSIPPFKDPVRDFTAYLANQLRKLKVKIELGREVDASLARGIKPDVIILATGGSKLIPKIPGHDGGKVAAAEDVLRRKVAVGQKVVIIGGGVVGCETADFLSEEGKQVTILEMLPELASTLGSSMRTRLLVRLRDKKVKMMTRVNVREISAAGIAIVDYNGQSQLIEGETVVIATGFQPRRNLVKMLGQEGFETYLVGDCVEPRDILEAITEGFRAALKI